MEITDFIFSQREESLLTGNYNAYRAHTTRKLHSARQRLGQTTPKRSKYIAKRPVTAEDVNSNVEYVPKVMFDIFLRTTLWLSPL